jgi:hypothetical protein
MTNSISKKYLRLSTGMDDETVLYIEKLLKMACIGSYCNSAEVK